MTCRPIQVAVWALFLGAVVFCPPVGCGCGGTSGGAGGGVPVGWWYDTAEVTVSASPTTTADTTEAAGAGGAPLLGIVIANPAYRLITVTGIQVHGEGDLSEVAGLSLILDANNNSIADGGEEILWSGSLQGDLASATGLEIEVDSATAITVLLTCEISPGAPQGAAIRAWVDGPDGDLTITEFRVDQQPGGRATSGWRTVGLTGTLVLAPAMPERGPFSDPGETRVPAIAARIRASSVETAEGLRLELEGWGSDDGWADTAWSLWIDGDGDGAATSPEDIEIAAGLDLDPGAGPISIALPDPIPSGQDRALVVSVDIGAGAPDNALFGASLSLTGGTGVSSSQNLPLRGGPVKSGIRIGTRGIAVATGRGFSVLDPEFGGPLAVLPDYRHATGDVILDPRGRWAARYTGIPGCPGYLEVLDLRRLEVAGKIYSGYMTSMTPSADGGKIYVSIGGALGIRELTLKPDLSGGSFTRTLLSGSPGGILASSPSGDRLYVAEGTGIIRVVDLSSGLEVDRLDGPQPAALDLTPDGSKLFVVSTAGRIVAIPVDGSPVQDSGLAGGSDVAVSSDGSEIYMMGPDSVRVLDSGDLSLQETRSFSGQGVSIAAGGRDGRALVLTESDDILVLDAGSPSPEVLPSGIDAWSMGAVK